MEETVRKEEESQLSTYTPYHLHSDLSLLDSCTQYTDYVDRAVAEGMHAISFSEHGKPLNWVGKKLYCEQNGIKFIHSAEIYMTESLEARVRDNYHTVLIARNEAGVRELNELVSMSCKPDHFYYTNRISFDEFLRVSDNIISTSACLASPLSKLTDDNPYYEQLARKYTFLEVQPHTCADQIEYNKKILELASAYGKPLIAGTDTHSVNQYKSECRDILIASKHKKYDDDGLDLTWKTYDELVNSFKKQGALTEEQYMSAIQNTNVLADMCEDFKLDMEFKYPILYGSREEDSKRFAETVERKFAEKVESGVIPSDQVDAFRKAIDEEMRVFKTLKMEGYMLSMHEILSWCKEQGFAIGPARGSVAGSRVAYVTDIIDLNPETCDTNFYRFANPDRLEAGDIDTDCVDTDRPMIFQHIVERFGEKYTARVASFGTISEKGTIQDIGRYLREKYEAEHPEETKNPWSLGNISKIKDDFDKDPDGTRKQYGELFYYFDGLVGTKVSQSVHPAGMVISSVTLDDNYGVFIKDDERCLMLDMDNAHEANLIKYDMLVLKTVTVLRDTCEYIGTHFPKSHEMNWNDEEVWSDMVSSPVALFQFEEDFAFKLLKDFKPKSVDDISLVTACIRPSGASYRKFLIARKKQMHSSKIVSDILEKNNGYLVYQEDIIRFLMEACGLSGGEADTVRRGIAKKKREIVDASLPAIRDGYCSKSDKPRADAEAELDEFLKVIEDASSYMFGRNHAYAYSMLTYYCAYFRYHYPAEFITAFLNNAANDDDIQNGTAYARLRGIEVTNPKYGVSRSKYSYSDDRKRLAKGLGSVKYLSDAVSDEIHEVAKMHTGKPNIHFVDVLKDIYEHTSCDTRQIDILTKIDFFSDFGKQADLLKIEEFFYYFSKGEQKKVRRDSVDGMSFINIIRKHSTWLNKSGEESSFYTIKDCMRLLRDIEDDIKQKHEQDIPPEEMFVNFIDIMGYPGFTTGIDSDRPKLYVSEVFPAKRRSDGKQFGVNIKTYSIGSGKQSTMTIFNKLLKQDDVKQGDIILCKKYTYDRGYYTITDYSHLKYS